MPPVSEAQRKAMWAAANGHSTLGIPRKVGEEFVGKDAKGHAAGILFVAPDGDVLVLRRSSAEANFAGHWALPGGGSEDGETHEQTAAREAKEEMGECPEGKRRLLDSRVTPTGMAFHTFTQPVDEKFVPKLNEEHSGYAWAPLDRLPQPMHPGVTATLKDRLALAEDMTPEDWTGLREGFAKWTREEERESEHKVQARDAIALDRAPENRRVDRDGHLHVNESVMTRATVDPYKGSEIPNCEVLGLDPQRVYHLFRDPKALKAGTPSLQGKPLLLIHKPVDANDHPSEIVAGAIINPVFADDEIRAELVVWPGEAIKVVDDKSQSDLSCGYHYVPVMTPGTFEGVPYDGVMTDIEFNHVALVVEGRVKGAVVGDSMENLNMSKVVLSRKAALTQGVLSAYLRPKLAADARIDLTPVVAKVTTANYLAIKPTLVADIRRLTTGKLAKDAKLDDMHDFLDSLDKENPVEDAELEANSGLPAVGGKKEDKGAKDEDPKSKIKEFLKDKLSAEDMKACDEMWDDQEAMDESEEEKKAREAKEKDDAEKAKTAKDAEMKDMVTKGAMDAAIADAVKRAAPAIAKTAHDAAMKSQREIREAEDAVRPYVGKLAMAHDSADDVYRTALTVLGRKVDGVHPSAFRAILEALPVPGANPRPVKIAQDSAGAKSFAEMFPNARPVQIL